MPATLSIGFSSSLLILMQDGDVLNGEWLNGDVATAMLTKAREQTLLSSCKGRANFFLILTGIGDEIYSTVDACNTAKEMWTAIERLQQGESLNVQDVKTNLFWEFGKFTSRDGESWKYIYSSAIVKHFWPAAQPYSDNYYQAPKPQRSNAPSYMQSSSTRPSASTRHKGKEIAKPVTPQSESVSEEDSDPEQARRDKALVQKNLVLLRYVFKKLYLTTNNNLSNSSNSKNKIGRYHNKGIWTLCQGMQEAKRKADWLEGTWNEEIVNKIWKHIDSFMAKDSGGSLKKSSSTRSAIRTAQSEKPHLYEIPYDTSDPANRFCPNGEETVTLEKESRSKLDKRQSETI
ncbi:hypothetical protein Tco_0708681 [Tanacetum coccineum]